MEDLKQIQEFFLNENVFVEAFKLEKALKGMGYNVKVKALDDFGKLFSKSTSTTQQMPMMIAFFMMLKNQATTMLEYLLIHKNQ